MNDFNLEYIQSDFNHPGKRIHKKKMKTRTIASTGKKKKYDAAKKDAYDRINSQNRDIMSIAKSKNMLDYFNGGPEIIDFNSNMRSTVPNEVEDALIELIDARKLSSK